MLTLGFNIYPELYYLITCYYILRCNATPVPGVGRRVGSLRKSGRALYFHLKRSQELFLVPNNPACTFIYFYLPNKPDIVKASLVKYEWQGHKPLNPHNLIIWWRVYITFKSMQMLTDTSAETVYYSILWIKLPKYFHISIGFIYCLFMY